MGQTWAELADDFRFHMVTKDLSSETIRTYLAYSKLFNDWLTLRERSIVEADDRIIGTFRVECGRTHSKNTVRNFTCALRAFYKFCVATKLRAEDPTAGFSVRKLKQLPRRPFSAEEVQAMKDAATAPVDLALLMMLIGTGIRIGEVTKVRVPDLDLHRQVALIRGKGNKERWVALPLPVLQAIASAVGERSTGPLLICQDGHPMSRERARKRLVTLGERAEVINVYPHRFRITFANHFLEAGGDMQALQEALGHEDIATTAHYSGFTKAKRALDQMRKFNMVLDLK